MGVLLAGSWCIASVLGAFIWLVGGLYPRLTIGESAMIAFPLGILTSAWVTYVIACCLSALEVQSLLISTVILLLLWGSKFPAFMRNWQAALKSGFAGERQDSLWTAAIFTAAAIIFYPVYSSHMIPMENGKIHSGGSCWADFPIHMHIAESFLSGRNQDVSWGDMHSPVFAGEKMAYPFLPDWHAAVLVKLGFSMRWGFFLPGWLLCASFMALLFLLGLRLTRSRLGAVLGILLTVGAGGMGGVKVLLEHGLGKALEIDTAQNQDLSGSYTVYWFAFMPHVFFPQRGANFAYPAVLAVLLLLWRGTDSSVRMWLRERRSLLAHAAVMAGMLPLVQAHSFIGLGIIIGTVFLLEFHRWAADTRLLWAWIRAGCFALALGVPQMMLFRKQVTHGHGGSFISYGWIHKANVFGNAAGHFPWNSIPFFGGFLRFWWTSTGPAVPLFFLAMAAIVLELWRSRSFSQQQLRELGSARTVQSLIKGLYGQSSVAGAGGVGGATGLDAAGGNAAGASPLTATPLAIDNPCSNALDCSWDVAAVGAGAAAGAGAGLGWQQEQLLQQRALSGGMPAISSSKLVADTDDEGGEGGSSHHSSLHDHESDMEASPRHLQHSHHSSHHSSQHEDEETFAGTPPASSSSSSSLGTAAMRRRVQLAPTDYEDDAGEEDGWGNESMPGQPLYSSTAAGNALGGRRLPPRRSKQQSHLQEMRQQQAAAAAAVDREITLSEHLLDLGIQSLHPAVAEVYYGRRLLSLPQPDAALFSHLNALSITGRNWDSLKFALGAAAVFIVGNYVKLQPWDRDNCKLFYLWVFVSSALVGALLAAPIEYLFSSRVPAIAGPGQARLLLWAGAPLQEVLTAANLSGREGVKKDDDATGAGGLASSSKLSTLRRLTASSMASGMALAVPLLLFLLCCTGLLMLRREYGMYHVLLDEDQIRMGEWIKDHVPPKGVVLHRDIHIMPSGCLAGRPSLIAYTGWMDSHGYNYHDRHRDREHALANLLKDSDHEAYNAMRRWGVRYVLGEYLQKHPRPKAEQYEQALARKNANPNDSSIQVPHFDPDMYLDGQLKRIFASGRMELFEVLGYGFPPN